MARSLYGGRLGDTVVSRFAIGSRQVLALPADLHGNPVSTVLEVYATPGGTHLTDLRAADGTTPITAVLVPPDGQIPAFFGPDGYNSDVWLLDPDGDYYRMDVRSAVGATGSPGTPGAPGAPGATGGVWFSGAGAPSSGTGAVGDWYINTTNQDVYKKTGVSTWTLQFNIKGAAGTNGTNGAGVPTGGSTDQILKKLSGTNFDTGWTTLGTASALASGDVARSTLGGAEKVAALSATTGTCTADAAAASAFTITPTNNWTLAFSNVPAGAMSRLFTIKVSEGATPRTMTDPANTTWAKPGPPTAVASKWRVLNFWTIDGGSNWVASYMEQV